MVTELTVQEESVGELLQAISQVGMTRAMTARVGKERIRPPD
jgi:hypothetical protein